MTDGNIARFTELKLLDGVGATRAALDAGRFLAMVDEVASRTAVE